MKEEEKVTLEGLSLYHYRSQEKKRRNKEWGKIVKGVERGQTENSLQAFLKHLSRQQHMIHNIAKSLFHFKQTSPLPTSCPGKTLTDKTSQNQYPLV